MIEFTYPDAMTNDQLERVLTAIEAAVGGVDFGVFVPDSIREAIAEHGEQAVHELIGSYVVSWCEVCTQNDPPNENCYRNIAREKLLAVDVDAAMEELRDYRRASHRYYGKVVTRCMECGRLRHGLEWLDEPCPEGWYEILATCHECDKWLTKEHSPAPEPTEDDLKAWLAEGSVTSC